jgi:uncharacterized protein YdcH (DUF465 family)
LTCENNGERARERFANLLHQYGAQVTARDEHNHPVVATCRDLDATYEIHFKQLAGNDYYVYQIWATPEDDNYQGTLDEPRELVRKIEMDMGTEPPLFETGVCVCGEPLDYAADAESYNVADCARSIICSSMLELGASVGSETQYWLCPTRLSAPGESGGAFVGLSQREKQRVSKVIDDIARLEVYRHKIVRFYDKYETINAQLATIENQVDQELETTTRGLRSAKLFALKDALYSVSQTLVEIAAIARALELDANSTASNQSNLKSVFRRWDERPLVGFATVSTTLLAEVEVIPEAYARLAQKIESVRVQMRNVTAVLRTKIDLEQQADILLIQRGLDWIQVIVLTDILFRFGVEVLLQETVRASLPIAREAQSAVLLAGAFVCAFVITRSVQWGVRQRARH